MERYRCEGCGRELFDFGDGPPPTRCEDCIPETGQGSRLVDQLTTNLRQLRRKAGIEREELAQRAGMSAEEIALTEREAAREPGVTRALRLAHSIGVSIDDLADRIYWNPGEIARSPGERRPPSERLSGFFLVLPANVPIFDPVPPRDPVASRKELAEIFGENVRSARERRHLFQKTLAHAADLSREGLSYIERGIHETTIETMLAIARALQVTPDVLLGGIAWEPGLPPCAPPRREAPRVTRRTASTARSNAFGTKAEPAVRSLLLSTCREEPSRPSSTAFASTARSFPIAAPRREPYTKGRGGDAGDSQCQPERTIGASRRMGRATRPSGRKSQTPR